MCCAVCCVLCAVAVCCVLCTVAVCCLCAQARTERIVSVVTERSQKNIHGSSGIWLRKPFQQKPLKRIMSIFFKLKAMSIYLTLGFCRNCRESFIRPILQKMKGQTHALFWFYIFNRLNQGSINRFQREIFVELHKMFPEELMRAGLRVYG